MAANPRAALMRNLPKKGWTIEGDTGTFEDLTINFGETEWTMQKKEGKKKAVDVATGEYGKSQMGELKKAAAGAGHTFAEGGGGGERKPIDEETKQKMREKRQAKAAERKAEKEAGGGDGGGDDPKGDEPGAEGNE